MREPVVLRDRAYARLFAFDDFVWRRSFHTGEESRDGAFASDPHAVSGRLAFVDPLPRFGGRDSSVSTCSRESWPLLHQYARRAAACATHPEATAQGHEADCDDHRWQAVCADPRRWPDLQERVRT